MKGGSVVSNALFHPASRESQSEFISMGEQRDLLNFAEPSYFVLNTELFVCS